MARGQPAGEAAVVSGGTVFPGPVPTEARFSGVSLPALSDGLIRGFVLGEGAVEFKTVEEVLVAVRVIY